MGPFRRLLNFGRVRPPAGSPTQATPFTLWYQQRDVPEGLVLTDEQKLCVSVVYACIRVVANSVGRSPVCVYTTSADGRRVELPEDGIGYLLNVRPNPNVTALSFWQALIVQMKTSGNGYAEIVRDQVGRLTELNVLPSQFVEPTIANGGEPLDSSPPRRAQPREVFYKVSGPGGSVSLGAEQVLHIRDLATVDGLLGDSVIGRASKAIATAYAIERFTLGYYGSNTTLGGIFKTPQQLTADQEAQWQAGWKAKNAGVANAWRTLWLPAGSEFQQLNHNAEQAQVIPARQYMVEDILRYFGVPPHKAGVALASQGYGRNLNELGLSFVQDALRPVAVAIQQEANVKLFPQRAPWRFAEFDLSEFTRGDDLSRAQAAEVWVRTGVKTVNEVREEEGLNAIGAAGDLNLIGSGLTVLDEENLTKPEPTEAPPRPAGPTGMGDQGETPPGGPGPSEPTPKAQEAE